VSPPVGERAGEATGSHTSSTLPILVSTAQAAAMLAISPRTLWGLTRRVDPAAGKIIGEIPAVRIGQPGSKNPAVRYRPEDLREWAARQAGAAPSPAALSETEGRS
jgi:hypothetical protein